MMYVIILPGIYARMGHATKPATPGPVLPVFQNPQWTCMLENALYSFSSNIPCKTRPWSQICGTKIVNRCILILLFPPRQFVYMWNHLPGQVVYMYYWTDNIQRGCPPHHPNNAASCWILCAVNISNFLLAQRTLFLLLIREFHHGTSSLHDTLLGHPSIASSISCKRDYIIKYQVIPIGWRFVLVGSCPDTS